MFIGREKELETLDRRYNNGKFEFVAIYGRRRVGKTALITEFCKNKKTILFPALETDAKNNLELLSTAIFTCTDPDTITAPSFSSFTQAFDHIERLARNERIVLVIDEYPYLVRSDPSVSSVLQHMIDHKFMNGKLMIILSGSSMSFMERQVMGYNSPLYGRRTGQIKLLPFQYDDIKKWFPSYSPEELALVYGVTGGVPMYLREFSEDKSIRENILDAIMSADALLFDEPFSLLKQELKEPQTYNAIITAIAAGRTRLSEISSAVGIESGPLTGYIDNLISLGIIKKERPILTESNKKTIYLIRDHFFRFWHRFVPKNMTSILSGKMSKIFDDAVGEQLPDHMGLVYEEICKEFLIKSDDLPFIVANIGQWWGPDPKTRTQIQVDIVALSHDSKDVIFGSCKYRNKPASLSVLNELIEGSKAIGGAFGSIHYFIFSKSGFDLSLTDAAGSDGTIQLIALDDLYGR
jgi:AAA+ ATPase superfamily predicted ATPase